MPVYQGTHYSRMFTFRDKADNTPIDVTGWTFEAALRDNVDDAEPLLTLTSANGGMSVFDGANGRVEFIITSEQTEALPTGTIVFDVLRTDIDPGPVWLFGGKFPVRKPVTR